MKCHFVFTGMAFAATAASFVFAQSENPSTLPELVAPDISLLSAAQLDELLAPLALYPDPLVALILPAATSTSDIVLASRYLASNPKPSSFEEQTWEDAVKSLARYPEIVKWMDENLAWTKKLGDAFARQPADVMNAIQRLRARATKSGALIDSPQQTVVREGEEIRIVPAQTEVIYVPRYDPTIVYVERGYYSSSPFVTFGIGLPIGYWLAYDCDWRRRTVYSVRYEDRHRVWRECRELQRPVYRDHGERYHGTQWQAWSSSSARRAPRHFESSGTDRNSAYRSPPQESVASISPRVPTGVVGGSRRPDDNRGTERSDDTRRRVGHEYSEGSRAIRQERHAVNPDAIGRNPAASVTSPIASTIPSVSTPPPVSTRPSRSGGPGFTESVRSDQRYRGPNRDSGERTRPAPDRTQAVPATRTAPPMRTAPSTSYTPPVSRATYQERPTSSQSSPSRARNESRSQSSPQASSRRDPESRANRENADDR